MDERKIPIDFSLNQSSSPITNLSADRGLSPTVSPSTRRDLLDYSRRDMLDLKGDYARISCALKKWKTLMGANASTAHVTRSRNTLLTSHLLYNLSFIRLKADLATIHRVALNAAKGGPPDASLRAVHGWSTTPEATIAIEHACSTWLLIARESKRPEASRANFNLVSHIALLHCAVVVWAYAGAYSDPSAATLEIAHSTRTRSKAEDLRLYRANTQVLMSHFSSLMKKISPVWMTVSSFLATVSAITQKPLPLLP